MFEVRPLTPTFGAEVIGCQIEENPSPELIEAVKGLWARYKILLFRDQSITEASLVDFSRRFGELEIHVRTEFLSPENPEILYISNKKEGGKTIGILADTEVGWHYDQIYLPRPAVGSLLAAHTLPASGGNTEFADMTAAFEALPESVRNRLDGAEAIQSYEAFNNSYSVPTSEEQKKRSPDIRQPVVRTHPVTGQKAIYICPGMTTEIVGWDKAESDEMLDYLFDWCVQPRFVYSHQWRDNDALLWDNACTMHRRDPFDQNQMRLMKRTTIRPAEELAVPF